MNKKIITYWRLNLSCLVTIWTSFKTLFSTLPELSNLALEKLLNKLWVSALSDSLNFWLMASRDSYALLVDGIPIKIISEIGRLITIRLNLFDLFHLSSLAYEKRSSSDTEDLASNKHMSRSIKPSANLISLFHFL